MPNIQQQIEEVLEQLRPALRLDGGGIELVKFDESSGQAHVRFQGACVGCPMSQITLKMGIQAALCEAVPEVREVVAVQL